MPDNHPPTAPRAGRWSRALVKMTAGLAVGLGLAEAAFHLRDHGAFPHLNLYVADERLGVRLRPQGEQRLALGRNPITRVRINREGFRGADFPPAEGAKGEVLVVGDSQVFGLGVEEGETASAALGNILQAPVRNAGVPTYGPAEYNAVVADLLAKRDVKTVVYVVNMANDLFEAARPNTERHVVWDGWAVRKETAPARVRDFPGRELLFGRSHLVYALRSYLHAKGPVVDERGFASEGTVRDLVGAADRAREARTQAARETEARKTEHEGAVSAAEAEAKAAEKQVVEALIDTYQLRGFEEAIAFQRAQETTGDIVIRKTYYAEESRAPPVTANLLYKSAEVHKLIEQRIADFTRLVEAYEKDPQMSAPRGGMDFGPYQSTFAHSARQGREHPLMKRLAEREAKRGKLAALRETAAEIVRAQSPMLPHLKAVKALCDARGARLLVVALPMDLQVSPAEWAKYGASAPLDMAPTLVLIEDLVISAEAIGALALDATPALAAAEPGAFLDGDIHLTPKGQRALAQAIAEKLGAR